MFVMHVATDATRVATDAHPAPNCCRSAAGVGEGIADEARFTTFYPRMACSTKGVRPKGDGYSNFLTTLPRLRAWQVSHFALNGYS